MSIDDRIRTATAATAATVREISPLALPDDLPGTTLPPARPRSRRSRRAGLTRPAGRGPRRLGTWLVPLAAAAAVIALAATLVAVRDLPRSGVVLTTTRRGQALAVCCRPPPLRPGPGRDRLLASTRRPGSSV